MYFALVLDLLVKSNASALDFNKAFDKINQLKNILKHT